MERHEDNTGTKTFNIVKYCLTSTHKSCSRARVLILYCILVICNLSLAVLPGILPDLLRCYFPTLPRIAFGAPHAVPRAAEPGVAVWQKEGQLPARPPDKLSIALSGNIAKKWISSDSKNRSPEALLPQGRDYYSILEADVTASPRRILVLKENHIVPAVATSTLGGHTGVNKLSLASAK